MASGTTQTGHLHREKRRGLKREYRPDLQGMRAVAVLTVFANHLVGWPPGGFVGVDIFFVLSGFFITGLLIRDRTAHRKLSFRSFYVRRVKRIVPSALLVLAVTVLAAYLVFPAIRARETLKDALYAAVFVSNFRFEAVGRDYFQQDLPPSPLQHYWSLSIEEQFYFVWPALLALVFALTRRKFGGLRKRNRRQFGLAVTMSALVLASFAGATALSADNPNTAYFSTFTRVWELGVGALVAIAAPNLKRIPSAVRPPLAYLGLAGVVGSMFLIDATVQFPAPWAALPVISTAFVIAAFSGAQVRSVPILTNPVARYFGDVSYTLYLWHFPVIVLLQAVLPKGPLFYFLSIALVLGLTDVTYRFYENPIRRSGWMTAKPAVDERKNERSSAPGPRFWDALASLGVVAILLAILSMNYTDKIAAITEETTRLAQDSDQQARDSATSEEGLNRCFGAPAMINQGCKLRNSDIALQPQIDRLSYDISADSRNCYIKEGQAPRVCSFGYVGADAKRIALVGESHATSLLPALLPVLVENKWSLTTFTGYECKFIEPLPPKCPFGDGIKTELLADPFDLVLFAQYLRPGITPSNYRDAWRPIAATGTRIAVMRDNPMTSSDALVCVARSRLGRSDVQSCGTDMKQAFPLPDPAEVAARDVAGTTVIDLTSYYCKDDFCPSVIGDVIVYRDGHHITATFARTLAKPLEEGLRRALNVQKPG